MATKAISGKAAEALKDFEEAKTSHDAFVAKVETRYKAYRGILEANSKAAAWRNKLAPPYVNHIVETTIASLLDEELRFKVRPRPKLYEPGEFELANEGAKALEILLGWQLDIDRFSEKQRPFALQNAIAGLTVAKTYWHTSTRTKKRLAEETRPVYHPDTGYYLGELPHLVETNDVETVYDGPCMEVVNVEDFIWDESATSLDKCRLVAHRTWPTFDELKMLEKNGVLKNVDELRESKDFGGDNAGASFGSDVLNIRRGKGRIELLEIWRRENGRIRVYTIGNRKVVLREADNPFWHGEFPFVVCSTQSDLFRIPGVSQVEKISELQEMLWRVGNQRLDNLELINNAIAMVREDVDDIDSLVFEPGALWPVSDPSQVQMWTPNVIPAEISLGAEQILKGDMQNLAGGFPFTSTDEARTANANTATEAALVSNLAQKSVSTAKVQLNYAYERIGQHFIELNQQFVREPVYVQIVGADSEHELKEIVPMMLQGDFGFDITPMNESLMRAERRAEQQALFQIVAQTAPVAAAMGSPWNLTAFQRDLLESFDKGNPDQYLSAKPQALPPQPQQANPEQAGPGGVTAPQSIDPAVSPSAQGSVSPEVFMQRAGAMGGGVANQ